MRGLSEPQIQNSGFKIQNYELGLQPAEHTQIQRQTAGLHCRGLRPAAASQKPQIHDSKLPFGPRLAKRPHEQTRVTGLRREKLRPANRSAIDSTQKAHSRKIDIRVQFAAPFHSFSRAASIESPRRPHSSLSACSWRAAEKFFLLSMRAVSRSCSPTRTMLLLPEASRLRASA